MKTFQKWSFVLMFALAGPVRAGEGGGAGHYTGTVVDDKRQPVAGATVDCYQDASSPAAYTAWNFALKEHGTTDSKGGFSVSAGDRVTLVVVKKEGLAPGWKSFTSFSGESSAPVVLTTPTALAGVVVDETGQPVADAEVWVSRAMPAPEVEGLAQGNMIAGKPARDCFSTRTSADGGFRIANFPAESQADLAARKAGTGQRVRAYFAGALAYASGEEALKLTLSSPGNIEGRVTAGGTGQPLSGVKLRWLGWMGGLSELDAPEPVLSGADGGFRIADAAPGKAAISAEFPGGPVADWVADNVAVTVASGETNKDVEIRAVKGGVAVITVLSRKGRQPMAGANISAFSQTSQSSFTAETGADGVARLRLPAGVWNISAVKEGWDTGQAYLTIAANQTNQEEVGISPSLKITGIVRDPAGAPVAGAIVSLGQNFGNNREVTTDANGRYEIKLQMLNNFAMEGFGMQGFGMPTYSLLVRSVERNLVAQHEIDETTTNLDLKLQPAVTLSVKVQDSQGMPLANAMGYASMMNANGGYGGPNGQPTRSDAVGRMEFTGFLPADGYVVNVSAKGYGSASAQMQAPARRTNRVVFPPISLSPANQKLAGKVLGPDSKPVAGANVSFQGEGQPTGNTTTDAEGRFAFDAVCEGPVQLYANSQGGGGMGMGGNFMNANIQAKGGDTNVVIQFAVNGQGGGANARMVTTSGRVLDPSGAPVSGAVLSLGSSFARSLDERSDEDGKYAMTWEKQNFGGAQIPFIYVRDVERHLAASHDLDETTTNLDLRLQEALTLSVKVQDAAGQPVPAATGNVFLWAGNSSFHFEPMAAGADDQGVIEIKDLPQERHYTLTIMAKGYGTASLQAQTGETKTNHFQFPPVVLKAADRKVAGQVLGPDGKPVPRANVNIQGEGQPGGNTTTDAEGRFVFDAVCEGPVRVNANGQGAGGNYMNGGVEAQGGDTNVVIQLALINQSGANARMVTTSGKVFDPSGAPVAGLRLSVAQDFGRNMDVRSDEDGTYSITWQQQNSGGARSERISFIYVRDAEDNLAVSHELDDTTTNLDLRLEEALTLSIKVQDTKDHPIPAAQARLMAYAGNMGLAFSQIPASADSRGVIEIKGLPQEWHYSVSISAKGYGSATFQAQPGETKTNHFYFPPAVLKAADLKLAGQVLGPDGKPVAGANVNFLGEGQPGGNTTTDAQGRFAFASVCEGPVSVNSSGQGAGGSYMNVVVGAQGGDTNVVVQFAVNGQGGGPNARMVRTSGKVLDPSGAPAAGARLSVAPANGMNTEIRSDADGKYSCAWITQNLGGGQTPFIYARDLVRHLAASRDLDETTTNLDLRMQEALTLSVKVQDAKGKPVSTAQARLLAYEGNRGFAFNQIPANADSQGVIEIQDLPQERHYSVTIVAKGYGTTTLQAQAAETKTNYFKFPPVVLKAADHKLAGQVLGLDGKPVAGADVNIQGEGQPAGHTTTDAQGRFAFNAVCEGPVRVYASSQIAGGNYLNGNIHAQGGDTNVVIQFAANGQGGGPGTQMVRTSGRVLDPSGAPVAGARLMVIPANGMNLEIRSDADGKYSIAWMKQNSGSGQTPFLYARDVEHHLAVSHDIDETTTNLDLRLQEGLTLSVKVRDVNGKPIPTAMESLNVSSGNSTFSFNQLPADADNQGVIEIKDLPQERHYFAWITAPGYGTAKPEAQAGETKTNHFDFPPAVLKAADQKLAGQVLGPDSKPVSRANVFMQGEEGQPVANTTTDARGRFALVAVCEGPIRLYANWNGNPLSGNIQARGGDASLRDAVLGAVLSGNIQTQGGDTNVVIRLGINGLNSPGAQLVTTSGKVLDPSGSPVSGARLMIIPAYGMITEIKSDADGKYSITWQYRSPAPRAGAVRRGGATVLATNRYLLVARDPEHNLASAVPVDEKATNVDVPLQAALTLSGSVKDPGGAPVKNATFSLVIFAGLGSSPLGQQQQNKVDAQGAFSIGLLPQGQHYSLFVTASGYGATNRQVAATETQTTNLQLQPVTLKLADQKLEGRVVDANDKPVPGAQATISGSGQPTFDAATTTDSKGHFVFNHVCEGPIRVSVFSRNAIPGGPPATGSAQAQGGDLDVVVKLGANPGATVPIGSSSQG
jgi:protocatechuate 3,4-dioxygenase beta subunit